MIYTCTLNTAIDMFVQMEQFLPNRVNRSTYDEVQPNGKGVNISIVLKKLGLTSIALGFVGGFSGKFVQDELEKLKIKTNFIQVQGNTRINVFINSEQGEFKVVNGGPHITNNEKKKIIEQISKLEKSDTLFVSGSLPKGIDSCILKEISNLSDENGFKLIIDSSDLILRDLMKYKPFLIKPNDSELQSLFPELNLDKENDIIKASEELLKEGCKNILVSVGDKGAYFFSKEKALFCNAPIGEIVNTAGAGDSMLAAFYKEYIESNNPTTALGFAVAVGSSTAFSRGLSNLEDLEVLRQQVEVISIRNKHRG